MHTRFRLLLALTLAALTATQSVAQTAPASAKVATVNGVAVPKVLFDSLLQERTQQGVPDNEQLRKLVIDELVNRELVVQEAARRGFTESAELKAQIELSRQTLIVRAFVQDLFRSQPLTDEALKFEYEKFKTQLGDREYRARHILVEKETEAKDIIARLKKGGKFDDLAKASKDAGSRDRGGDLGWNAPASYVPAFADVLLKLEKGKYAALPVQTQFGWHVIQLDDTRAMKTPPFEEAKPRVLQVVQQQMIEKALAELRAKAKIE